MTNWSQDRGVKTAMSIEMSVDKVSHQNGLLGIGGDTEFSNGNSNGTSTSSSNKSSTTTANRKRGCCCTSIGQVFKLEITLIKICGGLMFDSKYSKYIGIFYKLALILLTRWFMGGSYIVYTNSSTESKASMQNIKFFWAFNDFSAICALGATFVSGIRYHKLMTILLSKRFDRRYLTGSLLTGSGRQQHQPTAASRTATPTPPPAEASLFTIGGKRQEAAADGRGGSGSGADDDDTGSTSALLTGAKRNSLSENTTLTSGSGSASSCSGEQDRYSFTRFFGGAINGPTTAICGKGRQLSDGSSLAKSNTDAYSDELMGGERMSKVKLARILLITYVLMAATTAVLRFEYKRYSMLETQQGQKRANSSSISSSTRDSGRAAVVLEQVVRAVGSTKYNGTLEAVGPFENRYNTFMAARSKQQQQQHHKQLPFYNYVDSIKWLAGRLMSGSVKLINLLPMFCYYTCHVLLNLSQIYGQPLVTLHVTAVLTDMLRRAGEQEMVHERNYRALLVRRQAREHNRKLMGAYVDRASSLTGGDEYDDEDDDEGDDCDAYYDCDADYGGSYDPVSGQRQAPTAARRKAPGQQDHTVLQTTQLLIQVRDVLIALRSAVSLNFLFLQMLDMSHLMGVLSYFTSYIATNQYDWVALLCFDYLRLVFGVALSRIGYHWLHDEARKISLINERRLIESALNSYSGTKHVGGAGVTKQGSNGPTLNEYNQAATATRTDSSLLSSLSQSLSLSNRTANSPAYKREYHQHMQPNQNQKDAPSGGLSDTSSGESSSGIGGRRTRSGGAGSSSSSSHSIGNQPQVDQMTRVEATTNYRLAKEIERLWPTDWYTPDLKSYVAQNFFVITFVATLQQLVEASAKVEFQAQQHGASGAVGSAGSGGVSGISGVIGGGSGSSSGTMPPTSATAAPVSPSWTAST